MIKKIINDINNNKYINLKLNNNFNIYDKIYNFCDSFIKNYKDENNKNLNLTNLLFICTSSYKKHFFKF